MSREIGKTFELLALKILKNNGFKIITQNFLSRMGEIDIIASKNVNLSAPKTISYYRALKNLETNNILIFVEVKYRKTNDFGNPEEMVTYAKQQRMIKTANYFLQCYPDYLEYNCRFDIFSFTSTKFNWFENAFY